MLTRIFYTLLLVLISPLLLFKLYQKKQGKPPFGKRWKEHFGFTPPLVKTQIAPVWIHAVSVGESIAITALIKKLKKQHPLTPIVVTTTTSTGAEQISKLSTLVEHRYMPIDFAWCVKGFLKEIKPQLMIIVETELWPNTLNTVNAKKIPIVVINARLSARSAKRYQQYNFIWKLIANNISHFLCLHEDDATRFIGLGINQQKISITGSLKYDITISSKVKSDALMLRTFLGEKRPVIIAASTHKGEDEIVLSAFKDIQKIIQNALLILVPRHPERFNAIEDLCKKEHFSVIRRSTKQPVISDVSIYLADTMGEMLTLMAAADVTFMGGSLLGDKVGGHNFIEPAVLKKPIITGPSYYNFTDIALQLHNNRALKICNPEDLSSNLSLLLMNKEQADLMGARAQEVVLKNKGALEKSLNIINGYLNRVEVK